MLVCCIDVEFCHSHTAHVSDNRQLFDYYSMRVCDADPEIASITQFKWFEIVAY